MWQPSASLHGLHSWSCPPQSGTDHQILVGRSTASAAVSSPRTVRRTGHLWLRISIARELPDASTESLRQHRFPAPPAPTSARSRRRRRSSSGVAILANEIGQLVLNPADSLSAQASYPFAELVAAAPQGLFLGQAVLGLGAAAVGGGAFLSARTRASGTSRIRSCAMAQ